MRGALVLVVLLAGCGARTSLSIQPEDEDAGQHALDAGHPTRRDAGLDAGRDAGRRDSGPEDVECRSDRDCPSGSVCRARHGFAPADLERMPLVCGGLDPGAPVGGDCVARGDCDRGLCAIAGACVQPCADASDCGPGERCQEIWVPTSSSSMQPLFGCAPAVTAPPMVTVSGPAAGPVLGAGPVDDPLSGLSESSLVVWTAPADTTPFIEQILNGPTGEVVYDAFLTGPGAPTPAWGVSAATITDVITLLYPNGPNTPSSSSYVVRLDATAGATTERTVLQRVGQGRTYDMDAYLVGGGGWTSEAGRVPRELTRLVRDMNDIYQPVGIRIGEVRVHQVVGALLGRFQVLSGMSGPAMIPPDLPPLYRLSAGARRPSIHVFFVRTIDGALGIASGIPGPHDMPGTGASGVAIAVDLTPDDQLPMVVVHEVGHFMGLFHTSELDGSVNDPLTDTGECRSDRDSDGDGLLLPMECVGAGAENVMFWAGDTAAISDQQAEIMRRAFFVR